MVAVVLPSAAYVTLQLQIEVPHVGSVRIASATSLKSSSGGVFQTPADVQDLDLQKFAARSVQIVPVQ